MVKQWILRCWFFFIFRCRVCFNVSFSYRNIIQIKVERCLTSDHFFRFVMPEYDFILPSVSKLAGIFEHRFTILWPCSRSICNMRRCNCWFSWDGRKNTSLLVADNAKFDARILIWLTNIQTQDGRFFKWHCRISWRSSYKLESL